MPDFSLSRDAAAADQLFVDDQPGCGQDVIGHDGLHVGHFDKLGLQSGAAGGLAGYGFELSAVGATGTCIPSIFVTWPVVVLIENARVPVLLLIIILPSSLLVAMTSLPSSRTLVSDFTISSAMSLTICACVSESFS